MKIDENYMSASNRQDQLGIDGKQNLSLADKDSTGVPQLKRNKQKNLEEYMYR